MIDNIESKIDKEEEEILDANNTKNEKDMIINEYKIKYEKLIKKNYQNNSVKEINCLKNILENPFSVEKFGDYIETDFLDNCEYKLILMPDEFKMKDDEKYYFQGFGDKRRKKAINIKNKYGNKNLSVLDGKKNKKKFD
jgi:hypothetical protein